MARAEQPELRFFGVLGRNMLVALLSLGASV